MRFWKFEYEGPDSLREYKQGRSLPGAQQTYPGLSATNAHPLKTLRPGDGVLLATLVGDQGKIFAFGKVRSVEAGTATVDWTPATHTVFPDAKGGLPNWQAKSAFEISAEPAKRYGLKELVDHYVRDT